MEKTGRRLAPLLVAVALTVAADLGAQGPGPGPSPTPGATAAVGAKPTLPSIVVPAQTPGGTPTTVPLEAIPDLAQLPQAEMAFVNPLHISLEAPPRPLERPPLADLETWELLYVAVKLDENGRALEAVAVEPPLRALEGAVPILAPRWTFQIARKAGKPVRTWATLGLDLLLHLESGRFTELTVRPLEKEEPLPVVLRENVGDRWISRYPPEIDPKEEGFLSIEEVDTIPTPDRIPWKVELGKLSSRVKALLQISAEGKVQKLVPVGAENETLVVKWVRRESANWRFSPPRAGGKPVACWTVLEATLEYVLDTAKEKGKRSVKKNLRGTPGP